MCVDLVVLASAHRHGVSEEAIRHAVSHYVDLFDVGDGLTMVNGPDLTGELIEVGIVERYGDLYAVHAIRPARNKFLR